MSSLNLAGYVPIGFLYAQRQADEYVRDLLERNQHCYLAAPRQTGKSSVRVRLERHFRSQGRLVVTLDVQGIAVETSVEGLWRSWANALNREVRQFDAKAPEWNSDRQSLSYYLGESLLPTLPKGCVLFIEEIDQLRTLGFNADSVLAELRRLLMERIRLPALEHMGLCAIGVARLADLSRDPAWSPLNTLQVVYLPDLERGQCNVFLPAIASSFVAPAAILDCVFAWTCGHPFMTQKILSTLLLNRKAGEEDPGDDVNQIAQFVQRAVTESFPKNQDVEDPVMGYARRYFDRAQLTLERIEVLVRYRLLLSGEMIEITDIVRQQLEQLRIAGMVRFSGTGLKLRNPIFERTFDREWVQGLIDDHAYLEMAVRWREAKDSPDFLLHGEMLKQAVAWKNRPGLHIHQLIASYIAASQQHEDALRTENIQRNREREEDNNRYYQTLRRHEEALHRSREQWQAELLAKESQFVHELEKHKQIYELRAAELRAKLADEEHHLKQQFERREAELRTTLAKHEFEYEAQSRNLREDSATKEHYLEQQFERREAELRATLAKHEFEYEAQSRYLKEQTSKLIRDEEAIRAVYETRRRSSFRITVMVYFGFMIFIVCISVFFVLRDNSHQAALLKAAETEKLRLLQLTNSQIKSLRDTYEQEKSSLILDINRKQADLAELKNQQTTLQQRQQDLAKQLKEESARTGQKSLKVKTLLKAISDTGNQLYLSQRASRSLSEELEGAKSQLDSAKSQIDNLSKKTTSLQTESSTLAARLKNTEKNLGSLQSQLKSSATRQEQLETALGESTDKALNLSNSLKEMQDRYDSCTRSINRAKTWNECIQTTLLQLPTQCPSVQLPNCGPSP